MTEKTPPYETGSDDTPVLTELEQLCAVNLTLVHRMQAGAGLTAAKDLPQLAHLDARGDSAAKNLLKHLKHVRTGLNNSLCSQAAMADILEAKGIMTKIEYVTALNKRLEEEVANYEKSLSKLYGTKIVLG